MSKNLGKQDNSICSYLGLQFYSWKYQYLKVSDDLNKGEIQTSQHICGHNMAADNLSKEKIQAYLK